MYAKFIDEYKIEAAPVNSGSVSNFNLSVELMTAAGYMPVNVIEEQTPEKPVVKYRLTNGRIEQYAEAASMNEASMAEKENLVRQQRNHMLTASDWTQLDDAPLTENEKEKWRVYRQALRDIPSLLDFPNLEVAGFNEWLAGQTVVEEENEGGDE